MSAYSCSCANVSGRDSDEIKLSFEDFYELMSGKIIQQKRTSSTHTDFDSSKFTNAIQTLFKLLRMYHASYGQLSDLKNIKRTERPLKLRNNFQCQITKVLHITHILNMMKSKRT